MTAFGVRKMRSCTIRTLRRLQLVMNNRYAYLRQRGRRKIRRDDVSGGSWSRSIYAEPGTVPRDEWLIADQG